MKKKILFGTDHAGFVLKEALVPFVKSLGYEVEDLGAHTLDNDDDYPQFIAPVAYQMAEKPDKCMGIILGGSGQGEAIMANRFPGVRAAVFYGGPKEAAEKIIRLSREHNDANVLSLGARFLTEEEVKWAVKLWLETEFSGEERHLRRIELVDSVS